MTTQATHRYELAFMHELAQDAGRLPTPSEARILRLARAALESADAVVIHFGGRSGRLGEAIIGAAFLEGILWTLTALGREHTPLTVLIDASIAELMPVAEYRARYWPEIEVIVVAPAAVDQAGAASYASPSARNVLVLDFHAGHDGMPYLEIENVEL